MAYSLRPPAPIGQPQFPAAAAGGVLGSQTPRRGGVLGRIGEVRRSYQENGDQYPILNRLFQNKTALMGLGTGLLSGDWNDGFQGMLRGREADQLSRDRVAGERQEAERNEAVRQALIAGGMSPADADRVLMIDPGAAGSAAVQRMLPRQGGDPFTLGPDDIRYDAQGNVIAQNAGAAEGPYEVGEVVDGIGPNGQSIRVIYQPTHPNADEFGFVRWGGERLPSGMSITLPDGTIIRQGGGAGGNATEGQATAHSYATRMEEADPLIDQFAASGQNFWSRLVAGTGIVGNIILGQLDPEYQQFAQAARNFINASLRRESGATITPEEFANAQQQYLPMPGDTPEVLAQKAENRRTQIRTFRESSGPFTNAGAPAVAPAPVAAAPAAGEAPIGTRVVMPDGTYQVKTEAGWVPE